jgi:hypothetical protein
MEPNNWTLAWVAIDILDPDGNCVGGGCEPAYAIAAEQPALTFTIRAIATKNLTDARVGFIRYRRASAEEAQRASAGGATIPRRDDATVEALLAVVNAARDFVNADAAHDGSDDGPWMHKRQALYTALANLDSKR